MADIIYLTLNGNNQGLISAGCSSYDSIGNRYQNNHSDEILVYQQIMILVVIRIYLTPFLFLKKLMINPLPCFYLV